MISQPQALQQDFQTQGEQAAQTHGTPRPGVRFATDTHALESRIIANARLEPGPERQWIFDNLLLLQGGRKHTLELGRALRELPAVGEPPKPRAYVLATLFLNASEDHFDDAALIAFLEGYQRVAELDMAELWALRPTLLFVLLERLAGAPPSHWSHLITSLRHLNETPWKDVFEQVSLVEATLAGDPAAAYTRMDDDSRDLYRRAISDVAKHSGKAEREVAWQAIRLCEGRVRPRQRHVGFYLIDRGLERLRRELGYRRPLRTAVLETIRDNPTAFYLGGIELTTFLIVVILLSPLGTWTPLLAGFLLLLLPATQAAVDLMNNLATSLAGPRRLPKLDFSEGIPEECATVVAVPALLLNELQVRDLIQDMEIRFLANRDPNLFFVLLSDPPDSDRPTDARDQLVEIALEGIDALNRIHGTPEHQPFCLLHRQRVYNESEGIWMAWERKRGKLLDLNLFLRGGHDPFPVKCGDPQRLLRASYVITLDADTELPRDSARKLIGTIAHPLNRAIIDPTTNMVVEGYGILQPRIGVSVHSASASHLASLYSGQTGFDIYTRAVSDVYQDLFGEGIFTGKGIYEVDTLNQVLRTRFPENALLSHDLIEGAYSRAGLVSDIELIDDYPSHFSAYSRRKHRWVRGDWQILRWLLPQVMDLHGRWQQNPLTVISRWKILDNLRRSLIEPATLLLFLAGWLYLPGGERHWTAACLALLLMPVYSSLAFSIWRAPWTRWKALTVWFDETGDAALEGLAMAALNFIFLLHQSMLSIDAIVRSILRVFVTRRKLLEWETAAEAETQARRRAAVDIYLDWTPALAAVIGLLVWYVRPWALAVAGPVLLCWFFSRWISLWLNRPPRVVNRKLKEADLRFLRDCAERTWQYFRDHSNEENHWLVPDNVREEGRVTHTLSPTNLGMLLTARVAAVHLGLLTPAEFATQTAATLDTIDRLEKHNGHIFNWYDSRSLAILEPAFVSTVDSGNLAACLWIVRQAALGFASDHAGAANDLTSIADRCRTLVRDMDFQFLFHPRRKVMSVGYDVRTGKLESSSYDIFASESRTACFIAIAKGDIPQESWFHLDRRQVPYAGDRLLLSWTGTMFEYLMPSLWMRHSPDTIMQRSMEAAVRVQRDYARRKGIPWGISECAHLGAGEDYAYTALGVPAIAMKPDPHEALAITPYATFLALPFDPGAALSNLRTMSDFGWVGRYGFYEAIDYSHAGSAVIRSWMAHHEGMSLMAVVNVLYDNVFQRYFHADPHVKATELLLHERVPAVALLD